MHLRDAASSSGCRLTSSSRALTSVYSRRTSASPTTSVSLHATWYLSSGMFWPAFRLRVCAPSSSAAAGIAIHALFSSISDSAFIATRYACACISASATNCCGGPAHDASRRAYWYIVAAAEPPISNQDQEQKHAGDTPLRKSPRNTYHA